MAGIAKHFAILALRHLLIYHDYLSIVGLSIDSLSHIPMYIASKLSWHVASFLEFPLASERESFQLMFILRIRQRCGSFSLCFVLLFKITRGAYQHTYTYTSRGADNMFSFKQNIYIYVYKIYIICLSLSLLLIYNLFFAIFFCVSRVCFVSHFVFVDYSLSRALRRLN